MSHIFIYNNILLCKIEEDTALYAISSVLLHNDFHKVVDLGVEYNFPLEVPAA